MSSCNLGAAKMGTFVEETISQKLRDIGIVSKIWEL